MSTHLLKNVNIMRLSLLARLSSSKSATYGSRFTFKELQDHRFQQQPIPKLYSSAFSVSKVYSVEDFTQQNIEKALAEMDYQVRRTGRTNRRHVEDIVSMIKDAVCSKTHALFLIRAAGLMRAEKPSVRIELVNDIFNCLKKNGFQFDTSIFNALLSVYVQCHHTFSASGFLALIESHGVAINKTTYKYLMAKYCNEGDLAGASEILEFMKEKNLSINESIFNELIKGHMKNNDVAGAEGILEAMKSANLHPTADSFTALACGFAEKGDVLSVKSVLSKAENNGIAFTNKNYLSIISSAENLPIVEELLFKLNDVENWRQDILNTSLELIQKNLEDVAMKLVMMSSESAESLANSANFIVKQMVKNGKPVQKILLFCEQIYSKKGLNDFIYLNATKAAIDYKKFDYAIQFFQAMTKEGIPVREHYFTPIFNHYSNEKSEEGIWWTLKTMHGLGILAEFRTYLENVFPAVSTRNPRNVLSEVLKTGQSAVGAVDPLFEYYCFDSKFDNAIFLIENYAVQVSSTFPVEEFFSLNDDSQKISHSYIKVLDFMFKNYGMMGGRDQNAYRGRMLASFVQCTPHTFTNLLRKLDLKNHTFNEYCLNFCSNILENSAPDRLIQFRKLRDIFLKATAPSEKLLTEEEEQKALALLKERGEPSELFLRNRLHNHLKNKNFNRATQLYSEVENLGAKCSPLTYLDAFSLFLINGNLEGAKNALSKLTEMYPDFRIDFAKIFDYSAALVKSGNLHDAVETIKIYRNKLQLIGGKDACRRTLKRLLTAAVETGNEDLVKSLCSLLVEHSCKFEALSICLEPLINIHLFRNDLNSAVNAFIRCVLEYKVSPSLNFLLKKCLTSNDFASIETVVNAAAEGKYDAMCEFLIVCIETGRRNLAVKVLEDLGSKANMTRLEKICSRLFEQKKVLELEDFLFLVKDLDGVDNNKLFEYLFKLYNERNYHEKALNLYQRIETENMFQLNDKTKQLFSKLFIRDNRTAIPTPTLETETLGGEVPADTMKSVTDLLQCINSGNAVESLQKLKNMKKGLIRKLTTDDMSRLINLLVQDGCASEIAENQQAMSYLIENSHEIIKPLFHMFSEKGDVNSMLCFASFLPDFTLRSTFFNMYMSKAYINSGRHEELLNELEGRIEKKNKLFSIFGFEELLKVKSLEDRVIILAKKYFEAKFDLPIAVVWAHYLINANFQAAVELQEILPVPVEKVDMMMLKAVRQHENVPLAKKYIEALNESSSASNRCREKAYATLLEVLVQKKMLEEASSLITEAKRKNIDLEKYCQSTLKILKDALERENKSSV